MMATMLMVMAAPKFAILSQVGFARIDFKASNLRSLRSRVNAKR